MNYSAHQSKKRERQNWVYSFHVYKKKDEKIVIIENGQDEDQQQSNKPT